MIKTGEPLIKTKKDISSHLPRPELSAQALPDSARANKQNPFLTNNKEGNSPFWQAYQTALEKDDIQCEPEQFNIARALDTFGTGFRKSRQSSFQKVFGFYKKKQAQKQGIYLWGAVGRGKSMLTKLFFQTLEITNKETYHFHDFMAFIHKEIAQWRKLSQKERRKKPEYLKKFGEDPIPPIARSIARKTRLLYLDEFEVRDITDAMLLGRLFTYLLQENVSFILTSNTAPENLYKDGLNRSLFLPFIQLVKGRLQILHIDGNQDFRQDFSTVNTVYFSPLTPRNKAEFEKLWQSLPESFSPHSVSSTEGKKALSSPATSQEIHIFGRLWKIQQTKGSCARFSFDELCRENRSSADYIALAERFKTIFIEHIPVLKAEERNVVRRLTLFVDTFYDRKRKLVISAEAEPTRLYSKGREAETFQRTASRLQEMRSEEYFKA